MEINVGGLSSLQQPVTDSNTARARIAAARRGRRGASTSAADAASGPGLEVKSAIILQQRILLHLEASFRQSISAPALRGEAHPAAAYTLSLRATTGNLRALAGNDYGDFFSPQSTADRIVGLARSLYPAFRRQHPEMTDGEAVEAFHELAASGVVRGAQEARKLLVTLPAAVAWQVHETVELTLAGIDHLSEELMAQASSQPGDEGPPLDTLMAGHLPADTDAAA